MRLMGWVRRRLGAEDGSQLVEVTIATGVMGMAVIGLAGAVAIGLGSVGMARQRSAAAAAAGERIERVQNLPYTQVALYEQPHHSDDPTSPDYDVTTDDTAYNVDGSTEPLLVDVTSGALKHIEDPVISGSSELYVHQYVTWVDDPGLTGTQDYKRVTVVVTWRRALRSGLRSRVTMSTFVGQGSVTVPQSTPAPGSPSPAPTPTPSPAPQGSCSGDTTVPTGSISIVSGTGAQTGYTGSVTTQVRLEASDACASIDAELSNDGTSFTRVTTLAPDTPATVAWSIPSGDGTKTIRARYRDAAGNLSSVYTAEVVLDQTKPTVPGSLRQVSCSMSGEDRTVSLTWDASSDTYLSGYRLYRSIDSAAFSAVGNTSSTSISDTSKKTSDSVRYFVRAYDRAGNESLDSNVLTYARNSC